MWSIPRFTGRYIEPFLGGGALFFYLEPRQAIINDINTKLIGFYRGVRDNYETLRRELDEIEALYASHRKEFDELKAQYPDERVEDKNEEMYYPHFYALHNMNISYYGGKSVIVPMSLNVFQKMLEDSYKAGYIPNPSRLKRFFEYSKELAKTCENEEVWYRGMEEKALNWLNG